MTGQPNAMGGREVGGLANSLAAHMELENAEHRRLVREFWKSPRIAERPGLKAVELFEAAHQGRIKALWIMATNPVVSLPNADRAREALRRCEFVVVSDVRGANRHGRARARIAAGGRLGREGRHRHQLGPAYLPATLLPAGGGRGKTRLVDHLPSG